MNDDNVRDDIARLEDRIETLRSELVRCRKISFAAKLLIAGGAAWIGLVLVLLISFEPGTFFAAMAALLGGVVLLGSNATTWTQTQAALDAAETMRRELIGRMDLRLVGEEYRTIH